MVLLFDILHPAHVHFFRNAIAELEGMGHEVIVTARDKDLTVRLLNLYGIEHTVISREAKKRGGLALELLSRNAKLANIVRKRRPASMASIGGISTAQVGFLTRTRNYIFYDTEHDTLSNLLSYPFASEVVTPECYSRRVLGRHARYPGYHALAYLHPDRFAPDGAVLEAAGVDPGEPFTVVRFVSWKAVHDIGARGFALDAKRRLVEMVRHYGKIYISSETPLPSDFEEHGLPVEPHEIHHLLAFAQLFIGESATMTSESVILGTPAIYVDHTGRGYTDEQETRYQLCYNYRPEQIDESIERAEAVLSRGLKRSAGFLERHRRLLADRIDATDLIVCMMLNHQKDR